MGATSYRLGREHASFTIAMKNLQAGSISPSATWPSGLLLIVLIAPHRLWNGLCLCSYARPDLLTGTASGNVACTPMFSDVDPGLHEHTQ